jgi:hypothetical protein
MSPAYSTLAISAVASAAIFFWPLSNALTRSDGSGARVVSMVLAAVGCLAAYWSRDVIRRNPRVATAVAVVLIGSGAAASIEYVRATTSCTGEFSDQKFVIGRTLKSEWEKDWKTASAEHLLAASASDPAAVWTEESIATCRFWLASGALLGIALLAPGATVLMVRSGSGILPVGTAGPPSAAGRAGEECVYDAFLSYRHVEPDSTYALEVLTALESRGLHGAIDVRDFKPNEHFLSEMERCIKESRFTLCIITSRYLASDHCSEEAIISRTLDMAERKKRLVPLIFERVELPVWLHGIVGIDFTGGSAVDPVERLWLLLKRGEARA